MKTRTGIFLLLCLTAPLAVTWLALELHRLEVRREVRNRLLAGMDDAELTLLRFHREDAHRELRWKEEGEFRYRGTMYDVARSRLVGDSIHYLVWHDDAETRLDRALDALVAIALGEDGRDLDQIGRLVDLLRSLFFHQEETPDAREHRTGNERPGSSSPWRGRNGSPPPGPPPRMG